MSEWGWVTVAVLLLSNLVNHLRMIKTGGTMAKLISQIERQRVTIAEQERELNQWRREYGTLTNDAIWWQEEIG